MVPLHVASTPTAPPAGVTLVGVSSPRIRVRSTAGAKIVPGTVSVNAPLQDTVFPPLLTQSPANATPPPDSASIVAGAARMARVVGDSLNVRVARTLFRRPLLLSFIDESPVVTSLMLRTIAAVGRATRPWLRRRQCDVSGSTHISRSRSAPKPRTKPLQR